MFKAGLVTALGTMSGTSLDGVDAAILLTDGVTISGFGATDYRRYSPEQREVLRRHLGLWPEDDVSAAAEIIEAAHLAVMRGFDAVDIAGFHGQTLAHDPGGKGTHQCGDGARLAAALGYPVAWDFRSADVHAGGQGAPLAPFYHFALAKWINATAPIAFLNLGGVANITIVDPAKVDPADPGALLAFDTGPANAPIDDIMLARLGRPYDAEGQVAAQGVADGVIISAYLSDAFFKQPPPKSLDRGAFDALVRAVAPLADADAVATLTAAVAASVAHGVSQAPVKPRQLLVTGGGRKNPTLMQMLANQLDCDVAPVETVNLNGDMLEAQAFAYLAVRVVRGLPISAPETTGIGVPTRGGRVSDPQGVVVKKP